MMITMTGGRGAAFAAGPGFDRIGPPPFAKLEPRRLEATRCCCRLAPTNAKSPDGSTVLQQAVTARQVPSIKTLVAAGAKLDSVNKENLTPLLLAEKPEPVRSAAAAMQQDPGVYRPHRDTREEVIASLRELMKLGPDDPAPQPAPLPEDKTKDKKDEKKPEADE